tara:strand:+ start:21 stop:917 length:897 start_codon:yes stop_codon:yes gene_type:complete
MGVFISNSKKENLSQDPYVMVLGIAQDAGYPQVNCKMKCCEKAWRNVALHKMATSLAIIDPTSNQQWIIDATPDIKKQIQLLNNETKIENLNGVLLTHAHIGHYTGLMYFGREALATKALPVFTMPKMKKFLEKNGPWSQLVDLNNIKINVLKSNSTFNLNDNIEITPFSVPHRNEFSETIGFKIVINNKSLIFIPDIDKWEKWKIDICELIQNIDYAFLDGTFYKNGELKIDMSKIPHPFVEESMNLFSKLSLKDKKKIYFTHLNHTNPLLINNSRAQKEVFKNGFNIAIEGQRIEF